MKYIADILTLSRMVLSFIMLSTQPFSNEFYILYVLCGVSDMLDGAVARMTKSTGRTGEILDSIADIVFLVVSLYLIIPAVHFPFWVIVCAALIALIRVFNIIYAYIRLHRLVMLHTVLNKTAGAVIFMIPFALCTDLVNIMYAIACAVSFTASIHELRTIRLIQQD